MSTAKWKKFEKLVLKVQKDLAPNATVTRNDYIEGKITGRKRQVDISVKQKIGHYDILIAIDCKDLSRPVNVKSVEAAIGLFQDIVAHKGVVVSASGFTSNALTRGKKAGLSLYRLVDTGDHDWRAEVAIPALCEYRSMRTFSLQLTGKGRLVIPGGHPKDLDVYDQENKYLGKIGPLLMKRWNDSDLPYEAGRHKDVDFIGPATRIRYRESFFDVKISADITVERKLYFGYLPLVKVSGFKDEVQGSLVTKGFTTDVINLVNIQKSWEKIESQDELAVKPVMGIVLCDHFDLEERLLEDKT